MKMPTHCTFCNDVMVIEYFPNHEEIYSKKCARRVNHNVQFFAETKDDEVYKMSTSFFIKATRFNTTWVFTHKELFVISSDPFGSPKVINLPFFDPILNNYHRLIDKIKTYLVFSYNVVFLKDSQYYRNFIKFLHL